MRRTRIGAILVVAWCMCASTTLQAGIVNDTITYQGRLLEAGQPVTDDCDVRFSLWNSGTGGAQVGGTQEFLAVAVADGYVTLDLDFGASVFDGSDRWLEIEVRNPAGSGNYIILSPRQQVRATPYALHAARVDLVSNDALAGIYDNALDFTNAANTFVGSGAGLTGLNASNITGGTLGSARLAGQYAEILSLTNAANEFAGNGSALTMLSASSIASGTLADARLSGNVALRNAINVFAANNVFNSLVGIGTSNPTQSLHTTGNLRVDGWIGNDVVNTPVEFRVNNSRALQIQYAVSQLTGVASPNWIAGVAANAVTSGVVGATISGGGGLHEDGDRPNVVTDDFGTIGGGHLNQAGDNGALEANFATVGGGSFNTARNNAATVGGGVGNDATGIYSTIAGGIGNDATGFYSAISGGESNFAADQYAAIAGGFDNTASGDYSTVPGGRANNAAADYSFAAGRRAQAFHVGTFVWGDSTDATFTSTAPNQFLIRAVGVGINTTAPGQALEVRGTAGFAATSGSGLNGSTRFRPNGTAASLDFGGTGSPAHAWLQSRDAGDYSLNYVLALNPNGGNVGIGTTAPATALDVNGGLRVSGIEGAYVGDGSTARTWIGAAANANFIQSGNAAWNASRLLYFTGFNTNPGTFAFIGNVGIGDDTPDAKLDVELNSATVAAFNRTVSDGVIVSLQQDGVQEGTISVAGNTVTFNAFTGSHYGWTADSIERFALIRMTGDNRRSRDEPDSEIIYGIEPSSCANDPAILGAYLGPQESMQPAGLDNPHLIMSVGNGVMWVTDTGRDIEPGDLLISADRPGCAMLDDPRLFAEGHIVARAAEPIYWDSVAAEGDGVRRVRISVLFDRFTRTGDASAPIILAERINDLEQENANLHDENDLLRSRLERLETIVEEMAESRDAR